MRAWLRNADEILTAGDLDEALLSATPQMLSYLDSSRRESSILFGPRGSGRTFLLKAKRIRLERNGEVRCLPDRRLVEKAVLPAASPEEAASLRLPASARSWLRLWLAAFGLAALKQRGDGTAIALGGPLGVLLQDARLLTVVDHLLQMLHRTESERRQLAVDIDNQLMPALRALQSPAAFFVDGIDAISDALALRPRWHEQAEMGLVMAAHRLQTINHRLFVHAAVHETSFEVLLAEDEQAHRYGHNALRIVHTHESLRRMFACHASAVEPGNLVRPELRLGDPIHAFLGTDSALGGSADAMDFILRQTLQRPRDLMRMGHRLSLLAPAERAAPARQHTVVREEAAALADEHLSELAGPFEKDELRRVVRQLPAAQMTRSAMKAFCNAEPGFRRGVDLLIRGGLLADTAESNLFIAHPMLAVLIRPRVEPALSFDVQLVEREETLASLPPKLRAIAASQAVDLRFEIPWDSDAEGLLATVCEQQPPAVTIESLGAAPEPPHAPPMAAVALFPSGAVLTVGTARSASMSSLVLEFFDYWSLLDPEDTEGQVGAPIIGRARVLAVYLEAEPL